MPFPNNGCPKRMNAANDYSSFEMYKENIVYIG